MPKLPVISGQEAARVLERAGFDRLNRKQRGKGSHLLLVRHDPTKLITIPDHRELAPGTLRAIIRQADLSVDRFVELLRG
ncbi:MAG TPA: hypothetical protein DEB06_00075 [Phycisphaerales bacterium]|nr:hypothetical protein [Phycisphaerales bacterium]